MFLLASAAGLRAEPALQDGIAAIVNNHVIPLSEVREAARVPTRGLVAKMGPYFENRMFRAGLPTDPDAVMQEIMGSKEFNVESLKILAATLEGMIDRQLILDEFQKKGYRLPESLIDDVVKQAARKDFPNRVSMVKTLHDKGLTYEQYREEQREQFVIYSMVQQNLRKDLTISPKKIEAYYAASADRFKVLERIKLRLMLFDRTKHGAGEPRKLAEQALARIKAGETFAAVAKDWSDDSASRLKGGDRGWVENKDADLRAELRAVAFQLTVGKVSDVVELDGNCFLLLAEERYDGKQKSLVEVREEIEEDLKKIEEERIQKAWVGRLRKTAFVRYF